MNLKHLLIGASLLALAGCSVAGKVESEIKTTNAKIEQDQSGNALPKDANRGAVRTTDAPILGTQVVRPALGAPLPGNADAKPFGWERDTYVTIAEIAAKITEVTGIPVRVNDRRVGVGAMTASAAAGPGASGDMVVTAGNAPAAFQAALGGAGAGTGSLALPSAYQPSFKGTLGQFLQTLEPRFDVTVSYRDGGIVMDAYQVVTCDVPAPPTVSTLTAEVSGATTGAATGPTGSTSAQKSTSTAAMDTFAEVGRWLAKITTPQDTYEVSPSLRRFVVVGGSETTRRARQYCQQLNDFLSTRIGIEATIVEVTVNEGDDYGLNLDPIWQGSNLGVHVAGVAPQIVGTAGTGSIQILSALNGGKNQHWSGTQAFIKAASTDGRLANRRHAVAVLQNGRSQTLNMTVRQDYIRNITNSPGNVTSGATSGTQTDSINYGYSMQLTAHATGTDEIQIHGSLTISDLAGAVEKEAGENQIVQLLTVPQRSFDLDVPLGNNETLVLSGNENVRARRDRNGVVTPAFFLAGGSDKAQWETTRVVLFLTAWRLSGPRQRPAGLGD